MRETNRRVAGEVGGGVGVAHELFAFVFVCFFSATRSTERACERQAVGGGGGGGGGGEVCVWGGVAHEFFAFFFSFFFSFSFSRPHGRPRERARDRQTDTEKEWWGVAGRQRDRRRRERRGKERGVPGGRQRERGVT